MALAGVGRAEIRQRTGLDSHRVGSLLAKVRAEARGDAPAWDAAREASARRIYRAGVLVMAEHFGVTVAEFLLHATGRTVWVDQAALADGVLGPEGWGDGDVGAAGAAGDGNLGQLDERDGADGAGDDAADATAPRPDAPPPPPPFLEPVPGDAGPDEAAPVADTAAQGAAGEPGADAGAQAQAAAEAAAGAAPEPVAVADDARAADALSGERLALPPALPDTETEGEVHLRSWDGQRLSSVNALERMHKAAAARSNGRRSQFGQPSGPGVLRRAAARAAGVSGAVYGGAPSAAVPAAREPGKAEERPRQLFASTAAAVMGLGRAECRWPIGDPKLPGFGFCGQAAEEGRSYCAAHRQRATRLLPEALG